MTEEARAGLRLSQAQVEELRTLLAPWPARVESSVFSNPFGDAMALVGPGVESVSPAAIAQGVLPYHGDVNWLHDPAFARLGYGLYKYDGVLGKYVKGGWVIEPDMSYNQTVIPHKRGLAVYPFNSVAIDVGGDPVEYYAYSFSAEAYEARTPHDYGIPGYIGFALRVCKTIDSDLTGLVDTTVRSILTEYDENGDLVVGTQWWSEPYDWLDAVASGEALKVRTLVAWAPVSDYRHSWKARFFVDAVSSTMSPAPDCPIITIGDPQLFWSADQTIPAYAPALGGWIPEEVYALGNGDGTVAVHVEGDDRIVQILDDGTIVFDNTGVTRAPTTLSATTAQKLLINGVEVVTGRAFPFFTGG